MDEECQQVLFSEFVASFLLFKREINCLELTMMMSNFGCEYPEYEIVEPNNDFRLLSKVVVFKEKGIEIREDLNYDSMVILDDKPEILVDFLNEHSSLIVTSFLSKKLEVTTDSTLSDKRKVLYKAQI